MKINLLFALLAAVFLTACDEGVPDVKDPHHPTDASGNVIKGTEFIEKYCAGKPQNETCVKVQKAVSSDSVRGVMPKGY